MNSYSDNALMSKARALYGKRLIEEDYDRLLHSKSLADVASYLKNETSYKETLTEVKEELIHRGQLETVVRRRSLNIYMSFLKYSYGDRFFLTLYMMENEIRQLLLAIRFLNAGSMDRYIIALPVYLSKYLTIDLFALARIKTYDELLDIAEKSQYYAVLARFRPTSQDKPADITGCEKALLEYYYKKLLSIVDESYSGATREDLELLLYRRIDFHNISVAYRLKRYYGYSPGRIRDSMLAIKTKINPRVYDSIIDAQSDAELTRAVRESAVIRRFLHGWDDSVQELSIHLSRANKNMSRKSFRFSVKPMVVIVNYMLLLEIEVENIVNIIEGIRYKIPPDEIKSLIVV